MGPRRIQKYPEVGCVFQHLQIIDMFLFNFIIIIYIYNETDVWGFTEISSYVNKVYTVT